MSAERHIVPVRSYLLVFAALMALTVLTVWVAFLDFGFLNSVIAVGIAVIKATLVGAFFMHLIHAAPLTRLFALSGLLFFLLLIALSLSDYRSRAWLPFHGSWETPVEQSRH